LLKEELKKILVTRAWKEGLTMSHTLRQLSIKLLFVTGSLCFGFLSVHAVVHDRSTASNNLFTHIETVGMIESVDRGLTWHFKGHAQFHAPTLNPVDPSVMFDNGKLVLYFFDLFSLVGDTSVVYMSQASDSMGLDFTTPEKAFAMYGDFTDPAVIRLPGGNYRMYLHSNGIISATSADGRNFVQDPGIRTNTGGVPGAIVLPDGKVRLFVCGQGITSLISDDGLTFMAEQGIRIPIPSGAAVVADPHPIRCSDGIYRMTYKVRPSGSGSAEIDRVYLAESADGFTWTAGSTLLVAGSVPTLVELPDGRLRIYYVDFQTTPPIGVFKFIKSVQVTPDSRFHTGSFARVNYVPATDHLVVTFGTKASTLQGTHLGAGYAYKEYTLDLEATGKADTITWNPDAGEANDSGSRMVENSYYFLHVPTEAGLPYCWRLTKYDAVTWTKVAQKYIMLNDPSEANTDPTVACLGEVLDFSDQYNPTGIWQEGGESHHHFFTLDLDSLGTKILADTPHISGASMISAGGITYFVSADSYSGDLIVMKYDVDWNYLGAKKLMRQANWSQGVVSDGERFYVAYLNTSQRGFPTFFPVYQNAHLAAFDLDWNLLEDVSLTDFTPTDYLQAGRPWVIRHGNRLYVSFDVDAINPATLDEELAWQAVVNIYEIGTGSASVGQNEVMPTEFRLEQNYPNPVNPTTVVRYQLPVASRVKLVVYDLLGRQVAVLVNERRNAGVHEVRFDAAGLASGVYFYRLTAGSYMDTKKLLLIR
jgi:hypothetical protein